MIVLTIIIGIVPIFSAQALGTLIDKIIEGVKENEAKKLLQIFFIEKRKSIKRVY